MNKDYAPSYTEELNVYETKFVPSLLHEIHAMDAAEVLLSFRVGDKENSTFSAIQYDNALIARLKLRGNKRYIAVDSSLEDYIPEQFAHEKVASMPDFVRILLTDESVLEDLAPLLCIALKHTIENHSKTFDFCSRFLACSDSRKCVHPDKVHAMECGYRKILLSGKVFYGENANTSSAY